MRYFNMFRSDESGQDIAEYAVMLAVILIIVVGTVRLIGSNANNAFSAVEFASIEHECLTHRPRGLRLPWKSRPFPRSLAGSHHCQND